MVGRRRDNHGHRRSEPDRQRSSYPRSEPLVSSAIQVYEIYKVVRRDVSEERAVAAVSALRTTTIEPLAETLALEAADVALEYGLAMADAIIFATAARHEAEIVTGDADFEGLPRVTLIR